MRYAFCAILGLAIVACSSADLTPIQAGDTCTHCARTIDDPRLGARLVTTDGHSSTFHSPLCLARYLVDHSSGAKAMYVTDYPSGRVISVSNALFVRAKGASASAEREYYAYRHAAEAAARAKDENSSVIDWGGVRTRAASEKEGL